MVDRVLNTPIGLVGRMPLWWMKEMGVEWTCRMCAVRQARGSCTVEVCYKFIVPKGPGVQRVEPGTQNQVQAVKTYLCLECAIKSFERAVETMNVAKNLGPNGVKLMQSL